MREQGEDEAAASEVEGLGVDRRARGARAGVVAGWTAIGSMVSGQGSSSADKRKTKVRESLLIFLLLFFFFLFS